MSADRSSAILDWARSRLTADPHAGGPSGDEYRTTTIYFDTSDMAVFNRRGSYGRSKYRIRRYGASHIGFLERKLRTSDLLSKRRTAIAVAGLPDLFSAAGSGEPYRWFVDRVAARRLSPVCQVSYRRHALVGLGPYGPMRLTFDDAIKAQPNLTTLFAPDGGAPVATGQVIIEMKFCVETPAVLKHLVEEFGLSPSPISKYRLSLGELTAGMPSAASSVRSAEHRLTAADHGLANA
ncbi:MAG: polyphosphate polymerase domain-containing protein [Acidobacteria bacterium]|nr:polyphosphate polymerase domain-containing protein [Acidobacteriota bacterium]